MVHIVCDVCGEPMDLIDTDSRQEWREETYFCEHCNKHKVRRIEYNQNGQVVYDEVELSEGKNEKNNI